MTESFVLFHSTMSALWRNHLKVSKMVRKVEHLKIEHKFNFIFPTAKLSLGIEEYSFSQTTLEQVFLKLAHYDEETTSEVRIE